MAPESFQYPSPYTGYQSGINPHRTRFTPNIDAATLSSHQSWANSSSVGGNASMEMNVDAPCENCNYQHRCTRPAGSSFCHRCASLNLTCRTALERQSSSRPLACHDWPLTSENRYGNPPITNTASAAPLLPRSSKPQGTLETSVKRGPGRGCIPTLDARLSRLENLLGEALPNASQVLNPGKYASGLANNSSTTDHRWASYPSQLSLAGARTRRVSQYSTLELPEDPLLDGAMEDALLAGQPIHQLYSCGNAAGLPKKGNLSTAGLFLESSRK
ncbi:hypothetical protein PTTG_02653 [Puccinia triticina 1-1 BBBD Race 1]|uniref:Uncharacterized protein n=2 Tax=Puccinia triticina TaxID=208348 RepID=A0A0C4EPF2_PUCT1|nr:uncharacterized protein PtA15_1A136 [Puccinia triticina]OAV91872.1 hypothetical protein PTTG_02653 [Puccinia triticina 1-1 BBBD Race 1]WAQ80798.1 hypothetical protein PtA15_1A136 [Puccinia triticina]